MCRQLKAGSFPAQMVSNALRLPEKCGRSDLRGFKCGRELTLLHVIEICSAFLASTVDNIGTGNYMLHQFMSVTILLVL